MASIRNFIISFLISIVAFGFAAYMISNFVSSTIIDSFEGNSSETDSNVSESDDTEPTVTLAPEVIDEIKGESFSFLLIGTDYQPERLDDYDIESTFTDTLPQRRNRKVCADTVAVVRFSKETQKVLITTLPTDMMITVKGLNTTLGEVYGEEGLDFFINKVSALTGFDLDKYCVIDVENIPEIVDIIGGVSFYVPEDMKYEDPEQELVIDLPKGTKLLRGDEIEQLLRFDSYEKSENSREKTTADFLLALAEKLTTDASVMNNAAALFMKITEHVTTNYTTTDLLENLELIAYYEDFEKVLIVYPKVTSDTDIKNAIATYAAYR